MTQIQIDNLLLIVAEGIEQLNAAPYGTPGTVTTEQVDERARNIVQSIVGQYELVEFVDTARQEQQDLK